MQRIVRVSAYLSAFFLIAAAAASPSEAACLSFFHFNLSSQGPWPAVMRVKSGKACGSHRWYAGGTTVYKRLLLASKAQHGSVSLQPGASYRYSSQAGYRGPDTFTLRVCGETAGREGCSDIRFAVTVY